ncbi:MAG: hypothetical protein ACE148_05530 [Vicinamibacterales bacterium]
MGQRLPREGVRLEHRRDGVEAASAYLLVESACAGQGWRRPGKGER